MADRNQSAIGLHWLPIGVVTVLPITLLTTFSIAVYLGHVEPDFPYISDTGTTSPESCIFGQGLNIGAVFVGVTFFMRYKHIEEHCREDMRTGYTRINRFALALGFLSALGMSMVGNFQETNVLAVHLFGAIMMFGLGVLYCFVHAYLSFRLEPHLNSRAMAWLRLSIGLISAIAFIISTIMGSMALHMHHGEKRNKWKPGEPGFVYHVISTSSEWTMAIMFLMYFATFIGEFRRISLAPVKIVCNIQITEASSGIYQADEDIIT